MGHLAEGRVSIEVEDAGGGGGTYRLQWRSGSSGLSLAFPLRRW